MPTPVFPNISQCIHQNLRHYFNELGDLTPNDVYDMVLIQVEKPLLQFVLEECNGNQSKAAQVLGMNRNTFRKKLYKYQLTKPISNKCDKYFNDF